MILLCISCKKELKEGYAYCSQCGGDGWDGGVCKLCRGFGQYEISKPFFQISPSSKEEEPEPYPYPEYEEYWYDDPFCNGSGDCNVCNGDKKWVIDGMVYMCTSCNGTGRCPNCGGQGQCKGVRQVY